MASLMLSETSEVEAVDCFLHDQQKTGISIDFRIGITAGAIHGDSSHIFEAHIVNTVNAQFKKELVLQFFNIAVGISHFYGIVTIFRFPWCRRA